MALLNSFALWNNKGGVGKSTITFHLATRYAELHPDKDVLVIDLCPQANSSMMLLGGGTIGEQNVINYCSQVTPQTVVGYLSTVITNGMRAQLPNPDNFAVQASTINANVTDNLYLLCGDGNLEPISPIISKRADDRPLTQIPNEHPWVWIHNIFRDYINNFVNHHNQRDVMVFIDTNPAFGVYTELAIIAANKLICPVNADDSSRTAANAMTILLHGTNPPHPIYGSWTFAALAQQHNANIPQIHLTIGNRLTQYDGAATAFSALSDATAQTLYNIYQTNQAYFSPTQRAINSIQDFRDEYSIALRDFNTSGVVTSHLGQRLNQMTGGYYQVFGQRVQINRARVDECLTAIDAVIARL